MKAVGYVRVSTEGQAVDGVSMDAQEAKIRAWAELNNADEVLLFVDAGISGKRADNRPALQDALKAASRGDALVVYSLSRLARSTKDTLAIAATLDKRGADLVSLSERIDTTSAAGKMCFRMLAVLSEFERDQVSERTCFALRYKRVNGEKTGGDVPYGFRLEDGHLVEDEREQKAVALMTRLRAQGATLRAIAARLEAEGYLTKTGLSRWQPKAVAAVLARVERDHTEAGKERIA